MACTYTAHRCITGPWCTSRVMANPTRTEMHDVEELEVAWPDGPGRNSIVTFTDIYGNVIAVTLSTSATRELRAKLGPKS